MPFDKNKDHGEIFGDSEGRRYFQDGVYYDATGKQVGKAETPAVKAVKPAKAAANTATAPATGQLDAQLGGEQSDDVLS